MELIIKNINNPADKNLLISLAKRLGLVAEVISETVSENTVLSDEIKQGSKRDYVSKDEILKELNKWK